MESDVTATLSDLERKLKELERELEAVGRAGETDAEPAQAGWTAPAEAQPPQQQQPPPPPPPGATPFTASWHGGQHGAPPPAPSGPSAPPPPAFDGAPEAVPVPPPPAPWQQVASWQGAGPPPAPAPPAPAPAAGLHRQLDELLAFRERLVRSTSELVAELSRVLSDLGADVEAAGPPAPPPDPADTVLAGRVVIEVGPFADLASLAAFEQALAHARGAARVHVRALDAGRATIDVDLAEPVALAAELRLVAPVAFSVADVGEGWLSLAVAPGGGAPPA
jgi:hypothetical protein